MDDQCLYGLANAFGKNVSLVARSAWKNQSEFLTSEPGGKIDSLSDRISQNLCYFFQGNVSVQVSPGIVEFLEVIDIEQDHTEIAPIPT